MLLSIYSIVGHAMQYKKRKQFKDVWWSSGQCPCPEPPGPGSNLGLGLPHSAV